MTLDPPRTPADLFHYTNATALIGMIRSRELWATESNYLNDPSEVSYAASLVIEALRERIAVGLDAAEAASAEAAVALLERSYTDPHAPGQYREDRSFISSFSRSDESLTLWRTYAGPNGFAVGFAQDGLLDWVGRDEFLGRTPTLAPPRTSSNKTPRLGQTSPYAETFIPSFTTEVASNQPLTR